MGGLEGIGPTHPASTSRTQEEQFSGHFGRFRRAAPGREPDGAYVSFGSVRPQRDQRDPG